MQRKVRVTLAAATLAILAVGLWATEGRAVPVQWSSGGGGNDHFYDFIPGSFAWAGALADAPTKSHLGQPGYLATVTSGGEDTFIRTSVTTSTAWLSGSDAATEADWKWMAGPEAGQSFWISGVTQPGFVALWGPGEPNNALGIEHVLHMNFHAAPNSWNDMFAGSTYGYIIEFNQNQGSVPQPAALLLFGAGLAGVGVRAWRRHRGKP